MIIDQADIVCWSFLCVFQPFPAFFHNLVLFEVEVSSDDGLKSLWRVFDVLQHGEFDVSVSDDVGVSLILLFSFLGSLLVLKARLIEVNFLTHNDGLD